jgi:AAA domain
MLGNPPAEPLNWLDFNDAPSPQEDDDFDIADFVDPADLAPPFGAGGGADTPPVDDAPLAAIPAHTVADLFADKTPMPEDIIAPRLLTPGGMLVIGGAPKVGKSDLALSMLVHMAAGVPFLGFTPERPLRIFYLQAEMQYHYLRERLKSIRIDPEVLAAAGENLVITPKIKMLLDKKGIVAVFAAIKKHFQEPPDIIAIDPIRNVFDGGPEGAGENDNSAMMFFLQERIEVLRDAVAPDAGVVLCHHTRKITKKQLAEDPFQALSGASALRGFYTSGIVIHRPDEARPERVMEFELRNGPPIARKVVDKLSGRWMEISLRSERIAGQTMGGKNDAERLRKREVIVQLLADEACDGRVYTAAGFARKFENQAGLGGESSIRRRIGALTTQGVIKAFRNPKDYGLLTPTSPHGYLCVEGMTLGRDEETADPETGEVTRTEALRVVPTHFECPHSGAWLPVENPNVWVYQSDE